MTTPAKRIDEFDTLSNPTGAEYLLAEDPDTHAYYKVVASSVGDDAVDSVNSKTGVVVINPDDLSDASTTHKFTSASDIAKLAGIDSGAQVNTVNSVNGRTGTVTGLAESGDLSAHTLDTNNPHSVTKTQVGLGNVDNTSNATERGATATLTNKTLTSPVINTPTGIVKSDVGLGNVDNTSDTTKNAATVTLTNKTISGIDNTITNIAESSVTNLVSDLAIKAPLASPTFTGTVTIPTGASITAPTGLVKGDVGLSNVDNTSDANKPVSTAQQTALDLKANLASPALTGTPTAPTATAGTNTTQLATTAFVNTKAGDYVLKAGDTMTGGLTSSGDFTGNSFIGNSVNIGGANNLRSFNVNGSGFNGRLSIQSGTGGEPGVEFTIDSNTSRTLIKSTRVGTDGMEMSFWTEANGASIARALTIQSDGNLALGSGLGYQGPNGAYTFGAAANYASNLYATRHFFNSTADIDGSTAGVLNTTGDLRISTTGTNSTSVPTLSSSSTLTNKRITSRIGTETSSATSTPTADTVDQWNITALAVADAIAAPTGTPTDGQKLLFRIKDNGTARALTWNAIYRAMGTPLPTTTVLSKTLYCLFIYNSADTKWDLISAAQEI